MEPKVPDLKKVTDNFKEAPQQINIALDEAKSKAWIVYCFIGLFVVAGLMFVYNRFWTKAPINTNPVVAPESANVANVPKEAITGPKQLVIYKRELFLKKQPVPAEIANNPNNQFTASATIVPMPNSGTAVAFTNMSSGVTQIVTQANKRPLFGFGGKTSVGVVAGVTTRGNSAAAYVSQDVARVSAVNVGVAVVGGTLGNDAVAGAFLHVHGEF
jgi:hypothetical protein